MRIAGSLKRITAKAAMPAALTATGVVLLTSSASAINLPDEYWMSGLPGAKCLTAAQGFIYLESCNTGLIDQHWSVESVRADNSDGVPLAEVKSLYNGRCLDVEYDNYFKSYQAKMAPCDVGNDNQVWAVTRPRGYPYQFFNFHTYTCIDMSKAVSVSKQSGCDPNNAGQLFY